MAGPMIGGSAANDRVSTKVTSPSFNFNITAANPTPSVATVDPPGVPSDAKIVMADGAGTLVTAATFNVTVTGAVPQLGLEWKDTIVTGSGELIGGMGFVTATSGTGNAELGTPIWAGAADLLLASAGVGMAIYFHIGMTGIGAAGKIDQASGTVKGPFTVYYLVD